ncbi:MAG: preprotein translocase subunit SecA [Patescibacteria group bacterium]
MSFFSTVLGDPNKRIIDKDLKPLVARINAEEERLIPLTNEELKSETAALRLRLSKGETVDTLLPEAFAVVREAAKRVLSQRHFDVQLMGGIVLHRGQIAEMRTGEGKTLTATAPVYLNALSGKGVHVVTVNDYLAKRDAVWMGRVYHVLGLSVGIIQHEAAFLYDPEYKTESTEEESAEEASFRIEYASLRPVPRGTAYGADITYGTNNEFGFDYLRDNLIHTSAQAVGRGLHYAIVDEVDSILIDEARTPLIISAPAEESADLYYRFADIVATLKEKEDYNVDEKMRAATLTEDGLKRIEEALGLGNVYTTQHIKLVHHIEQGLKAHALFKRDKDYVVKDNEVIIVDEFTGRLMYGRRYSEGLHQAIEAKEKVTIQRESQTHATISFQNLFRLYEKLSGMTGTAATEAEEFHKIYKLEVVTIPTNRSMGRVDSADRVYKNEQGKYAAVIDDIKHRHIAGQPVLVGTISIEKNEYLSKLLEREGVPHQLLNAKNHEREAEIIAQAGRKGTVTIATNMAGRGVDIILGGNPPDENEAREVRERGGLHVLGTERHESRRIDNQLRGRAGRQGDPGSSQFYISMEDDLMRIFGSERMKGLMDKLGIPDDMPIENKMVSRSIEEAQKKVEGHNFDIRKHLVEYDDVLNKHRDIVYKKRNEVLTQYDWETYLVTLSDDEREEAVPKRTPTKSLKELILEMVDQELEHVVHFHTATPGENGDWNGSEIIETIKTLFPLSEEDRAKLKEILVSKGDKMSDVHTRTEALELLTSRAREAYAAFETRLAQQIHAVYPDADSGNALRQIERDLMLRAIDSLWLEHLEAIDHLRAGIGLRGYGQRDPLVEYKREAYRLFAELIALIAKQVAYSIFKIGAVAQQEQTAPQQKLIYSAPQKEGSSTPTHAQTELGSKVGRNDPCPCGSGKKFKRCHGA